MTEDLTHEPLLLEVQLDDERRLTIQTWETPTGRRLVAVKPEYVDRSGVWHLSHSGLLLAPAAARQLAPALVTMAASIELPEPSDPVPTAESREDSRWP